MTKSKRMQAVRGAGVLALAGSTLACGAEQGTSRSEREAAMLARAEQPAAAPADPALQRRANVPATVGAEETMVTTVTYSDAEEVYRNGRYADAAELFGVYVSSRPTNPWGHFMHGLSLWKSGQLEEAEASLRRAVELDGTSVKARTNHARVLLEAGRAGDALAQLHAALELAPDSHEIWRVIGNAKGDLGRGEEALLAYREALVLNPTDAWSMNNYGLTLIRLGRHEDAIPALARAVELVPGSALFQNNLGAALERCGEFAGARQAYAAAVAADPSHERARVSLERVGSRMSTDTTSRVDLAASALTFATEIERWSTTSLEIVVK